MSKQYPYLFAAASGIAFLVIWLSWLNPQLLSQYEFGIAGLMILVLGMPHGATDYLIYRQLSLSSRRSVFVFIFYYILLMFLYGLFWVYFPAISLLIFIVLSVYHFGQSNWVNLLEEASKTERLFVNLLWGAFVLGWPLLLHQETAISILEPLLGRDVVPVSSNVVYVLLISLLGVNVIWLLSAYIRRLVSRGAAIGELCNLLILSVLFACTPLLVGFAIYFSFWHSLSSIGDQIQFFRKRKPAYRWSTYVKDALPFSVIALLGLGGWLFFQTSVVALSSVNMGWLFAFIAMLTLPHMLLIERLHEEVKLL